VGHGDCQVESCRSSGWQ